MSNKSRWRESGSHQGVSLMRYKNQAQGIVNLETRGADPSHAHLCFLTSDAFHKCFVSGWHVAELGV